MKKKQNEWALQVVMLVAHGERDNCSLYAKKTNKTTHQQHKKNNTIWGDLKQLIKDYSSDKGLIANTCRWHYKEDLKCPNLACMLA